MWGVHSLDRMAKEGLGGGDTRAKNKRNQGVDTAQVLWGPCLTHRAAQGEQNGWSGSRSHRSPGPGRTYGLL